MTIVFYLLVFGVIIGLSALTFHAGYYVSQSMHSYAMVHHHERMLEILEDRMPDYHDVHASLDLMRVECRRDPSFVRDFLIWRPNATNARNTRW